MGDTYVNGVRLPFVPARGVEGLQNRQAVELPPERQFRAVLQEELGSLKFSKHAQERLLDRNITLNDRDMASLKDAVTRAGERGGKDSLVFLRDMAFIVNIQNRTVVTAMDSERLRSNVFTNIDSAVVAG
jgi:flagellar operon protein